jgi:hypothetical protein
MSGLHAALDWDRDPLTSAADTYTATAPDGRVFQIDVAPFGGLVFVTIDGLPPIGPDDDADDAGIFGTAAEAARWAESQVTS